MLSTLQKHDLKTRQAILAAAALRHDGRPYLSENAERYAKEAIDVLDEVANRLQISRDDKDYQAKVRAYLSDQVIAAIMGDDKVADVAARLGSRGQLPISSFTISFSPDVFKHVKENEKYIRRAILSADDVQHISAEDMAADELERGMTLVVIPQEARRGENHWMLVVAIRGGSQLAVNDVLRVFPSVVDLTEVQSPLDMLRAFIRTYGHPITIDGCPPQFLFEQIVIDKSERQIHIEPVHDESGDLIEVSAVGATRILRRTSLPFKEIAARTCVLAAFGVNLTKYLKDRRRLYIG